MTEGTPAGSNSWLRSRGGLVCLPLLAVAAAFLWQEHQAHLLGILPYLLLLLCPIVHLLHGGHRRSGHGASDKGHE